MRLPLLPAAALALLAACSGEPAPAGRPPPPPPGPSVKGAVEVRDAAGAPGPFRLGAVTRLAITARAEGLAPGPHAVRLEALGPRGHVYAQWTASAEADASGALELARTLEVSGTPIESFRQAGPWRFVLGVDAWDGLAQAEASLAE